MNGFAFEGDVYDLEIADLFKKDSIVFPLGNSMYNTTVVIITRGIANK